MLWGLTYQTSTTNPRPHSPAHLSPSLMLRALVYLKFSSLIPKTIKLKGAIRASDPIDSVLKSVSVKPREGCELFQDHTAHEGKARGSEALLTSGVSRSH